jgi:hypothetical protein
MDAERNSWTDDRLDDFRRDMDRRFDETNRRFDEVNQRMDAGFARVDANFARVDEKFDAQQRVLVQIGWTLAAAMLTLLASTLGLFITQL